jgi:hypothetical protein
VRQRVGRHARLQARERSRLLLRPVGGSPPCPGAVRASRARTCRARRPPRLAALDQIGVPLPLLRHWAANGTPASACLPRFLQTHERYRANFIQNLDFLVFPWFRGHSDLPWLWWSCVSRILRRAVRRNQCPAGIQQRSVGRLWSLRVRGTRVAQLAETFGMTQASIYSWLKQDRINRGEEPERHQLLGGRWAGYGFVGAHRTVHLSVVSLRMCPLLITPRKESQAIDNVKSVLPVRGDPQLLEGVSRSLREGCDRTFVVGRVGELAPTHPTLIRVTVRGRGAPTRSGGQSVLRRSASISMVPAWIGG